jgi:hypothetical protein
MVKVKGIKMRGKYTARNIKTGDIYEVISLEIINATNGSDNEKMVLYKKKSMYYVRNYVEFFQKFDRIKPI